MSDWKPLIYNGTDLSEHYEYNDKGWIRNKKLNHILKQKGDSISFKFQDKHYRINKNKLLGKPLTRRPRKDKGKARTKIDLSEKVLLAIKVIIREELDEIFKLSRKLQK